MYITIHIFIGITNVRIKRVCFCRINLNPFKGNFYGERNKRL